MAQRRKSGTPDLSGLLVTRPMMRGGFNGKRFCADWQATQDTLTADERKQAQELTEARARARTARSAFGRMPALTTPYRAFGMGKARQSA